MTTRKLLIAGGVIAGAYVLWQMFKPATPRFPSTATRTTADGGLIAGLIDPFVAGVTRALTTSGPAPVGAEALGLSATPVIAYNAQGDVAAVYGNAGAAANYEYADTHPGAALPEGVYGPPVPTTTEISGSDNGLSYEV